MAKAGIERVLSCPTLPSLPAVALRVIELTRDPNVRVDAIASEVQNDSALAAKILRTVNSSYYGLAKPCPTIRRAITYLGLSTVKSLVLGFSLIEAFREDDTSDGASALRHFWRRGLYAAGAARLLALETKSRDPEEAFVGALLADLGVLACLASLGPDYAALASAAIDDHDSLHDAETKAYDFDHHRVGAALAKRWRLPDPLVACLRFHHAPQSAPAAHRAVVHLVRVGMLAADALIGSQPRAAVSRFLAETTGPMKIERPRAQALLTQIAAEAKALGRVFSVGVGAQPDVKSILAQAGEQLVQHQLDVQRENDRLRHNATTDGLTGALNRKAFDDALANAFTHARQHGSSLAMLFTDGDRFKSINDTHGHPAGDAVLVAIARRLAEVAGGSVYRYGGEEFAALAPGLDAPAARDLAERLRARIADEPIDLTDVQCKADSVRATVSIGVALFDPASTRSPATVEQLVHAADQALYRAKQSGRNRVCLAQDDADMRPAAAAPSRLRVMLVEDDPLAARLIEAALGQSLAAEVRLVGSAEIALDQLDDAVQLFIVDLSLPGMDGVELVRRLRRHPAHAATPIIALSASVKLAGDCARAGATEFIPKQDFCADMAGSLRRVAGCLRKSA